MRVCIDPDLGGATIVEGGVPTLILSAGYIGSTMFGGVLILAGFDTLVAKIMSFIIGIGLLCPLVLVRDKLYVPLPSSARIYLPLSRTIITTLLYEGLLVGFWFIDHAYVSFLVCFGVFLKHPTIQTGFAVVLSFPWGHEVSLKNILPSGLY